HSGGRPPVWTPALSGREPRAQHPPRAEAGGDRAREGLHARPARAGVAAGPGAGRRRHPRHQADRPAAGEPRRAEGVAQRRGGAAHRRGGAGGRGRRHPLSRGAAQGRLHLTQEMIQYYARRAAEYERVYELPHWQPGLARLHQIVAEVFPGRRVLEVACGTGYWTVRLAAIAARVSASDINEETLEIARGRVAHHAHVTLALADAYA